MRRKNSASDSQNGYSCALGWICQARYDLQLAQKHGVELPSYEEDELRRLVFKDKYDSLEEYLIPFGLITACMQSADACERCAMEFAEDLAEGVRYFEVRLHCSFMPQ